MVRIAAGPGEALPVGWSGQPWSMVTDYLWEVFVPCARRNPQGTLEATHS